MTHPKVLIDRYPGYKRIAVEEAWAPKALIDLYRERIATGSVEDPGFRIQWGYFSRAGERASLLIERIQDLGDRRLADMDAAGIDLAVISLTCPGIQIFDADEGSDLAERFNDELAQAVGRHPERLAGLACIAPQNPARAALELERAVGSLGLKGAIINSHTQGKYLDDPSYWDIFASAEALGVPIYLHPNTPPATMIGPMVERGLEGAMFGFAVETGMHALRLVIAGVFDRFPGLQIVLGHLGEGLPFWLPRLDYLHQSNRRNNRYGERVPPLKLPISAYLRNNFHYTTSGMPWQPAIMFVRQVMGPERLLYAMDYPYQYEPDEVVEQDALPLPLADKQQFFQHNAERLFRL